jgi:small subunit ribosomal protein S7
MAKKDDKKAKSKAEDKKKDSKTEEKKTKAKKDDAKDKKKDEAKDKKAEPKPKKDEAKEKAAPTKKKTPTKTSKKTKEKEDAEEPSEVDPFSKYGDIKLFNKWSYKDVEVYDPGLKAYISLRPVLVPHTGGIYANQRFKKAEMPIVERLVNKLMKKRRGTGKKERMIKAVKIAFEIIHLQTNKNPIQVLIDAIQNAAPREEVTRITYGGMAQLQSVDVAPMRRVDIALSNIVEGVYRKSFNNILSAEEILAKELIDAADNRSSSYAVSKMLEIERVALSAR